MYWVVFASIVAFYYDLLSQHNASDLGFIQKSCKPRQIKAVRARKTNTVTQTTSKFLDMSASLLVVLFLMLSNYRVFQVISTQSTKLIGTKKKNIEL